MNDFILAFLLVALVGAVVIAAYYVWLYKLGRKDYESLEHKYNNYVQTRQDWEDSYNKERLTRVSLEEKLAKLSNTSDTSFTIPFNHLVSDRKMILKQDLISMKRVILELFYMKFEESKKVGINLEVKTGKNGETFLSGELIFDSSLEIEESDIKLSEIDNITDVVYEAIKNSED